MEFTGERPTLDFELESSRLRYAAILPYTMGKEALDFGCGVGHGSYMLSHFSSRVTGYEPNEQACKIAKENFEGNRLFFASKWNEVLFRQYEVIASVEVIEHLEKDELDRQLKLFCEMATDVVVTTPNGDLMPYQPATKEERRGYHVWHYTHEELKALFGKFYQAVFVSGHAFDPAIKRYTGYTVYATNRIPWSEKWLSEVRPQ